MSNRGANTSEATVEWGLAPAERFASPLTWTGPYVECKLEHPDLEPTCLGEQFFPDSIPYETDDEQRVFYWRRRLPDVVPPVREWTGVCATTHELAPLRAEFNHGPTLVQSCPDGSELVVDGTIVGDSKTALVAAYSQPDIELVRVTPDAVELTVEGSSRTISAGTCERIPLSRRSVETTGGATLSTRPELVVRFPGRRTLYHPNGEYCLFPSFGIDLETVPSPVEVPTAWGELDYDRLASAFGIDIAARPYPERILWQAFAVTAFDPNAAGSTEIAQFPSGALAVRS
ncbi:hypothetical protein GRX03_12050 [Halovenus sp. WSH3]|uniref:Uncharacterized protein n=1 Tax=Halovenus carboxidivorans TaxID=2692199 RepID=A0A6B0TAD3_9EURY|nr:hypothetical protein [Halovenus carboxidivorans]MXR52332.1 hypothetical protein [Halovenus carboxidivorans]